MDLLDLTNAFLIETGVSDPVASLEEAVDDVLQAAHWINTSWASFQRMRLWPFRRAEGFLNVAPGKTSYTFAEVGLTEGDIVVPGSFYCPLTSPDHIDYAALRAKRRGAAPSDQSRVSHIAISGDVFESYPDVVASKRVDFDYWRGVQALILNADVPYGLPAGYHMLLVHRAVAKYAALAGGQEGANLYAHHGAEFAKIFDEYLLASGVTASGSTPPTSRTLL